MAQQMTSLGGPEGPVADASENENCVAWLMALHQGSDLWCKDGLECRRGVSRPRCPKDSSYLLIHGALPCLVHAPVMSLNFLG